MAQSSRTRWLRAGRDLWRALPLWFDPNVPWSAKLIPVAAALYIVLPVDLLPDPVLGLGQIDDLIVLLMALKVFVDQAMAARNAAAERVRHDSATVEGSYRIID